MQEESSNLPSQFIRWVDKPYGGLFGSAVIVKVVEELIADPESEYRIRDLTELLNASPNSIKSALVNLEALNLVTRKNRDPQRPVYIVNNSSRTFTALNHLTLALDDDRDGTEFMNEEILNYCDMLKKQSGTEFVIANYQGYNYILSTESNQEREKTGVYSDSIPRQISMSRGVA